MIKQLKYLLIILTVLFNSSCNSQVQSKSQSDNESERESTEHLIDEKVEYDAGDVTTNGFLDKSGNMWFTTTKEGVIRYDGNTFTNFTKKDGLCSNSVNSVIEDNKGILWFATAKGLCSYDGDNFYNIPLPKGTSPDVSPETGFPSNETEALLSLIQDRKGDFWLGTDGSGAYHYDGKTFTSHLKFKGRLQPPNNNIYNNCIQSIIEDDDGNIWFTSQTHGGISRYDGKSFTHFTKEDGLPDDMIFSSFKDKDGTLWFGTLDNGFISYKEGSFIFFNSIDATHFMVSCFYQDKTGKLLIGSFREKTISLFDGKNITSIPFDKDKNLVEIRFITEDEDGKIWFGGRYGILYRYDGKELKDFTQLKRGE